MAEVVQKHLVTPGLRDCHRRRIRYLRLAVTSRCNLNCIYCRPAHHPVPCTLDPPADTLVRLVRIMGGLGISKFRLTGGEPLVRKDLVEVLQRMRKSVPGSEFHLTTNGVQLAECAPALAEGGITRINVSLDAADPDTFHRITGRRSFDLVMDGIHAAIQHGIPLKINCVVLRDNVAALNEMAELVRQWPITVRFIEAMPFNGLSTAGPRMPLRPVADNLIRELDASPESEPSGTARIYRPFGAPGRIGFIYAYSRTFCNQCDRIRVTPEGQLQLCLYQEPMLDLFQLMDAEPDDASVADKIRKAVQEKPRDGHRARSTTRHSSYPSMAQIGG